MTGKIRTLAALVAITIFVAVITVKIVENWNKEASNSGIRGEVVYPVDVITQMGERLGSRWKKIETIKNKWYGPYNIKNGTKWRVAKGGITVRVDKNNRDTYKEYPGSKIKLKHGKQVEFLSLLPRTVVFFKY
ncbi:MAG: hypothetical protein U9P50_00525 [Patescibacteria group bacterium]|nr:hypothetical protein [Patescibacteria group bacterium]